MHTCSMTGNVEAAVRVQQVVRPMEELEEAREIQQWLNTLRCDK